MGVNLTPNINIGNIEGRKEEGQYLMALLDFVRIDL